MCRILAIKSEQPFDPKPHIEKFRNIAKNSKEFQGHGWGLTYFEDGLWKSYHNISPIWEDENIDFPEVTRLLVHARSAFQDEGIEIENNMPFIDKDLAFIFNGELRGVRIKEEGRIGAEKIFNFIQRFRKYGIRIAIDRAIPIIAKRSSYIRALNFVIADENKLYISNYYNEDPDYFNLHYTENQGLEIISSGPYNMEYNWLKLDNYSVTVI